MRKLTVGLLLVAAALAYLAIDIIELPGATDATHTFFRLVIWAIELPIVVMLVLQFVTRSPRAVAATAAIAFVTFAGLLPFLALIIFLSVIDFMNDGLRWGLLCTLVILIFAIGLICRRRYRDEPAEGVANVWSGPAAISAAYVLLAYVLIYSYIASTVAERASQ